MRDGSLSYYKALWDTMRELPDWQARIFAAARRVVDGWKRFELVAEILGLPWQLIGLIAEMESACNWESNLHNGESWRRVTKLVPEGRGPFGSWEQAAMDALKDVNKTHSDWIDDVPGWSIYELLRFLERYNGGGYMRRGVNSPYLWSGSNHGLDVGKYVSDGDGGYKADAVSKQVGAAIILGRIVAGGTTGLSYL